MFLRMVVRSQTGFTLIELLVVIAVIGVLAAIAIPHFSEMRLRAQVTEAAADLRNFKLGFLAYSFENDDFPNDTNNILPGGMEDHIIPSTFNRTTPLGGRYNWEGPNFYPYAGISITNPTASIEAFRSLDTKLDDGDLSQGMFRITSNGRYTYIVEE